MPPSVPPSKKLRLEGHGGRSLEFQATRRPSAISALSEDVLFYIFSINSHIAMIPWNKAANGILSSLCYSLGNTLTNSRYSSQVCRRWRNICLSSPTIWASFHIGELKRAGERWRQVVLDRSGDALITLVGLVPEHPGDRKRLMQQFIVDLLEHEWHRIRCLSICTDRTDAPRITAQLHRSIQRPAPYLEHLLYWLSGNTFFDRSQPSGPILDDGQILFSNCSPRIALLCLDRFNCNFTAPRPISTVRQLWLLGYMSTFTILELHRGLQQLPMLEEIFIDYQKLGDSSGTALSENFNSSINLPALKEITLRVTEDGGSSRLVTDIVKHIIPAQGCRLLVNLEWFEAFKDIDLSNLSQVYPHFITQFADFKQARFFTLNLAHNSEKKEFRLRLGNTQGDHLRLPETFPLLDFAYSSLGICPRFFLVRQDHNMILEKFSIPIISALAYEQDLSNITHLNISLDKNTASLPEVLGLLRTLRSVVELEVDLLTMRALTDIQAACDCVLFPRVINLVLKPGDNGPKDNLRVFLETRVQCSLPVHSLDLPKDDSDDEGGWNFLDEFENVCTSWLNEKD